MDPSIAPAEHPGPRVPRAVPLGHAFAWYQEAMRLFKRAPLTWCVLGLITVVVELGLQFVPSVGVAIAKIVVPVIECGMIIGAVAVDRGVALQVRMAFAGFAAPPVAIAAIVVSALLIVGAEALTAYWIAGVNLLEPGGDEPTLSGMQLAMIFAVGTLVSLPVVFVPFAALLDNASFARAFAESARGFVLNVVPLLVFGALALVLVLIGLLSFGFGLIAVFPLLTAASYAAWKDVYSVAP
ncbi:MAG: hypothetical protein ABI981_02165 [Betaproteobacteria bacterium]